jgi:hypothetical protein
LRYQVGVANRLHGLQGDPVEEGHFGDASLVDSASADIGSCSRNPDAEGPTSLSDFFSTFGCAFIELILTATGGFAFFVLFGAFVFDALLELVGLRESNSEYA